MKAVILRIALIATWLCLVGWLIRHEAYPEYFSGTADGYKSLIPRNLLLRESWMAIKMNDVQVGYTRNVWNISDKDNCRYYANENQMYLWLEVNPAGITVSTDSTFLLDAHYNLYEFTFTVRVEDMPVTLKGARSNAGYFDVSMITTGIVRKFKISIPSDSVLFTPSGGTLTRNLKPGQSITLNSLDPFTMKKSKIVMTALRKENIEYDGISYNATLIATKASGLLFHSWLDQSGDIVRQTSPFGLLMERSTMEKAMAWTRIRNQKQAQSTQREGLSTTINETSIQALIETFLKGIEQ